MKELILFLAVISFALLCGVAAVHWYAPPEPVLIIDAQAQAEPPPIPFRMCIWVLPPPNRRMKGIVQT